MKEFEGVLGYFLGVSYIIIPLIVILSVMEGLIHPPFINRYVWAGISVALFAFCFAWMMSFYSANRKKKLDGTSMLRRYGLYVFTCFINSIIFCVVIVPVALSISGVSDQRVKDYVLIYPLISSLTVVSGVYVAFRTSHINLDGIFI